MISLIERLDAALRDRYRIQRQLGEGGMATVYLADDLRHGRRVAIKVLKPELAAVVGSERFLAEIRTTANLQHPNILPLFDSGEADGLLYYVMPYVEGPTLAERVKKERQLPVGEAVEIIIGVLRALDFAHSRGVVHRDVKPGNVLLQDGHVLVADFGIAQIVRREDEARLTETGLAVGTPAYMSPEQAAGDAHVDRRTDVYAAGAVLYEMLTGRPPHEGPTAMAVLSRALTVEPEPVSTLRPQARALERVLQTALQRLPADRYPSAQAMADQLAELLPSLRIGSAPAGEGAGAPTVGKSEGHRRGITGLVAIAAATVVLLIGVARVARDRLPSGGDAAGGSVTIAVLPFRALGTDAASLAPGITLTARDRLTVVDGLDVVGAVTSETGAFEGLTAPAIAAEVGADYVLRATVEHDLGSATVTVRPELYGRNGTRIDFWEEPIVVPAGDLATLETTIAEDVVTALDLTIGAAARGSLTPPSANPEAYEAYLRAASSGGREFEARLREAVALDSTLALAHADLAHSAFLRWYRTRAAADSATFYEHATAALRHAPEYSGGYLEMGIFHRTVTLDADSATYYLDRARAIAPGDADISHFRASVLWFRGQMDSALVEAERGAGLDRLNASAVSRVARILLWQHRLPESEIRYQEARPLALRVRSDYALADGILIRLASGDVEAARAELRRIEDERLRARTAEFVLDFGFQGWVLDDELYRTLCSVEASAPLRYTRADRQIACSLAAVRRADGARAGLLADSAFAFFRERVAERPQDERFRMRLALAQLIRGDTAAALASADTAYAAHDSYWDYFPGAANATAYVRLTSLAGDAARAVPVARLMLRGASPLTPVWLEIDPAFDPIRDDPSFVALGAR
jgi:serine/threonine-protein kinase